MDFTLLIIIISPIIVGITFAIFVLKKKLIGSKSTVVELVSSLIILFSVFYFTDFEII